MESLTNLSSGWLTATADFNVRPTMFAQISLLVLALLAAPLSAGAQSSSHFTSDVTSLSHKRPGFNVEVILTSRMLKSAEIIRDAEPGQFPEVIRVVQSLKIKVNGREIFVPRSAYADLVWVGTAELTVAKSKASLKVTGGDASESYYVRIEFDAKAVRSRSVYSGLIPEKPVEQTRYFLRVLN
jgi:hypothetical protein